MIKAHISWKMLILSAFLMLGHNTRAYSFTLNTQFLQSYWHTITNQLHKHSQILIGATSLACAAFCAYKAYQHYQEKPQSKLKALEAKYLNQVNTEMDNYLNSLGIPMRNLDPGKNCTLLKNLPGDRDGELSVSKALSGKQNIPENLRLIIMETLINCGIDTNRVLIYLDPDSHNPIIKATTVAASYESAKHDKLLLLLCIKLPTTDNDLEMFLFKSALAHEAAHLLYQDSLKTLLIFNQKLKNHSAAAYEKWCLETMIKHTEINNFIKICEKRADIFSVFRSPNPYKYALHLQQCPYIPGDLYAHRHQPEWQTMLDEIKSCR